jgi:acyl-CoA dehydrogenase
MNFDFSEDTTQMREDVAGFLRDQIPSGAVRRHAETGAPFDRKLWSAMAAMGWLGVSIPETYGGSGLGYEALCMLAEEIGRALAPVPFSSSICLAAEALLLFGSEAQKHKWLPKIADGSAVGAFALAEGAGEPAATAITLRFADGKLFGQKRPVFEAPGADVFIVAARSGSDVGLFLVEAANAAVTPIRSLEVALVCASVGFDGAPGELLPGASGWHAILHLLQRAAVLVAFEQVGGAQGALNMAVAYAQDRFAFGRPIGSLQAIKHQLADVYVATELARSNAYFGASALDHNAPELPLAAATARVAGSQAFEYAATQNIQTHGGMGFTWDSDCHLFYRRAKRLAGQIGGPRFWRSQLIENLITRNAP